jgi:hypothetical protein
MKRQTALQWLLEQWPILESQLPPYIINQVLEMEREQIEDAWMDGMDGILHKIAAEKYYNETYGGQDEN